MTILNVQIGSVGQSGQVPVLAYLNTNDTVATVTTPGYLNSSVAQGNLFSITNLAVVVTQSSSSPFSAQTGVYTVSFSDGDWSLSEFTGASTSGNNVWTGSNTFNGAFNVSSPDAVTLQTTGVATDFTINSSNNTIVDATFVLNLSGQTAILAGTVSTSITGGASSIVLGSTLTIEGVLPVDIGGSVAVMWNSTTHQFYHA